MPLDPSNSDWLEQTIESTRRSVRKLEIDACRIRTDLARLEVANATGVIPDNPALAVEGGLTVEIEGPEARSSSDSSIDWQPAAELVPEGMDILVGTSAQLNSEPENGFNAGASERNKHSWLPALIQRSRGLYRRVTSPMAASLAVHGALVLLTLSITVATIDPNGRSLKTILRLGEKSPAESDNIDLRQLADLGEVGAQNPASDLTNVESIAAVGRQPRPIDFKSLEGPVSLGQTGLASSIPGDLGTLMAGMGGFSTDVRGAPAGLGHGNQVGGGGTSESRTNQTRKSGRLESTLFFGTEARGNRFVFVVDNSSSMKGGRLEMAVAELIRTINGLSARQSFYVVFVSDQPYPMFYPQREASMVPATPANKQRLAEWAPKAILASGRIES